MTNVHLAVVVNSYCNAVMCELVKDKGAGMLQSMRSRRVDWTTTNSVSGAGLYAGVSVWLK